MRMVETGDPKREVNGSFNNGGERLNTLETFHQRLSGIEDCCVEILGHLPNLERQAVETEKQWVAIEEIRGFVGGLSDKFERLTKALEGLNARLDKRHPGAEP